ncbi:MAG: SDR family oxidoreductase [Bradymonadales bacterium]|nr:SDR family oxidoreductase [Bradymonadales bacterium]
MNPFLSRIAIVTGGASGIGRALVEELVRRQAVVLVADINLAAAQDLARRLTAAGGNASAVGLDVSDRLAVERVVQEAVSTHGRLDFMFNNAGIQIGGDERDMTADRWQRITDVNYWGVVHGTRAAYAVMVRQGGGQIVNTASMAGLLPIPTQAAYCATKWGVVGLSRALRTEGTDLGIKINVVCPGAIDTPILRESEIIGVDNEELFRSISVRPLAPDRAALAILKGVAKNRGVIVFPFHARLLVWIERYLPWLSALIWRKAVHGFRELRDSRAKTE